MKKSQKNFLYIGLSIVGVLLLIYTVNLISEATKEYESVLRKGDNETSAGDIIIWYTLLYMFNMSRLVLASISLVKNGYVFLGEQSIIRKILCLLSSVLVITACILMFCFPPYDRYFYASWVVIILSFILGSLKFGKDKILMKKTQKIFLCIGISFIMLSFLMDLVDFIIISKKGYEIAFGDGGYEFQKKAFWNLRFHTYAKYMTRMILSEVCLVKNGYVFLGEKSKTRRIICLISSAMVIIAYILMYDFQHDYYVVLNLGIIIISFILGSLKFDKKKTVETIQ
ncbi:MAG: hypothetical protein IKL40_05110 [Clostridia bacterium]|nr:hypothetical protein [Clostridia bacterium]